METEEVSERYITPCFVSGLHAYDGKTNLKYEKNMISNEFAVKLCLDYKEKDGEKVVKKELFVFKGELYFFKFIINLEEDDVDLGVVFGRSFLTLASGIVDFGNGILTVYSILFLLMMNRMMSWKLYLQVLIEEMEEDLYERIMILNERRQIIETLKYSDKHKKLLNTMLLDKIKLDREFEVEEEMMGEDLIKDYKAIKEKNGPGVFVLPIRLEGKYEDQVNPINDKKITMLDHSKAEPMGRLLDMLCQAGVTTILASFLLLDIPVDRDVPIIVGRSNSDDDKEYSLKRDGMGKPIYRPSRAKYLNCDDPMDRALAFQETLNPFKKICVWKKAIAFLGSLPVPLKHAEWIPIYSKNFAKKVMGMENGTLRLEL
ncbi:hypothetical protein Tco_1278120 [Tanacetum coccineum]